MVAQLRIEEHGLVLKHLSEGTEKVHAVSYKNRALHLDEYIYEEEANFFNEQMGCFKTNTQTSNHDNWRHGQGNQDQNYIKYNH